MNNENDTITKKAIMVYASSDDSERYKKLQKEFKKRGMDTSALFRELLNCYDKFKGGF